MRTRMRTTLMLSLLAVSFGLTTLSLLMIRTSLRRQIHSQLEADLSRSAATFQNLQMQRRQMLAHEADLLADLPSLKALMTTEDERTIADGAARFAHTSGNAFFALMNRSGQAVACYEDGLPLQRSIEGSVAPWGQSHTGARGEAPDAAEAMPDLLPLLHAPAKPHYVKSRGRLFEVSLKPLYFGSAEHGTLLGHVVIGYAIDNHVAKEVSDAAAADAVFQAGQRIFGSTLDAAHLAVFRKSAPQEGALKNADLWLGAEHYLVATSWLSPPGPAGVKLSVLKSFDQATRYQRHLNQLLLLAGAVVLILACVLAIYISGTITRPLEELLAGVRALGRGEFQYPLGSGGALELRELRTTFDTMRERLHKAQQELLESERLATIGSMASSISHDLRHYLSAVYANAEFLGYATTRPEERAELLVEVQLGIQGMTELIESLLIFSRTGQALQLTYESLPIVAERAASLLRNHPDAQSVAISLDPLPAIEHWMDAKKIERAIYNLMLNACHAAKFGSESPHVRLQLEEDGEWIIVRIEDNGRGIPASLETKMFQPFVSEGKHGGSGLGLTLANHIAQEHGGSVTLEASQRGRTVFKLALSKTTLQALRMAEIKAHSAIEPQTTTAAAARKPGGA